MAKRWQSRSRRSESGFGRRRMGGVMRLHSISDTVKNGNSKTWWKYFAVILWAKDRVWGILMYQLYANRCFDRCSYSGKAALLHNVTNSKSYSLKELILFKILNKSFVKYCYSCLWNTFSYFSTYKFCNKWHSSKLPIIWVRTLLLMKANEAPINVMHDSFLKIKLI